MIQTLQLKGQVCQAEYKIKIQLSAASKKRDSLLRIKIQVSLKGWEKIHHANTIVRNLCGYMDIKDIRAQGTGREMDVQGLEPGCR